MIKISFVFCFAFLCLLHFIFFVSLPCCGGEANPIHEMAVNGAGKMPNRLVPYKKNFLLPAYFVQTPDETFYQSQNPNITSISHIEMKFQFSVKYPIFMDLIGGKNQLYVAYSQVSYWQAYQDSAFFRESDYSPEVFMRFRYEHEFLGWRFRKTDIGFIHESNGLGGAAERSWNRLFLRQRLDRNDWQLSFSLWYRMPWLASLGIHEYNANITDYMGHTLLCIKKIMGKQIFSVELRNQFDSGFSKGAEIVTWSYQLRDSISVFVEAFSGYGQSLGEYNHYTNSLGVGFGFSH